MEPIELNWKQKKGLLNHSSHEFSLTLPSRDHASDELDKIYESLKEFDQFNGLNNGIAVKSSKLLNGVWYLFFDSLGFMGFLSDRINAKRVPVRAWSQRSEYKVVGDTAKGHMLVGQRRWQAIQTTSTSILVKTESYEQPCGLLNRLGMKMMGASKQLVIWRNYLNNIRAEYSSVAAVTAVGESSTSAVPDNIAWEPIIPYPGIEVP